MVQAKKSLGLGQKGFTEFPSLARGGLNSSSTSLALWTLAAGGQKFAGLHGAGPLDADKKNAAEHASHRPCAIDDFLRICLLRSCALGLSIKTLANRFENLVWRARLLDEVLPLAQG